MVFDHVKKAGIFSSYFAAQCTPFDNDSVLPPFEFKIIHRIKTLSIENETIINIIRSLDSNESSAWYNLSHDLLIEHSISRPCLSSHMITPLNITFENCLIKEFILIKHLKENYGLFSLLSILSKILEKSVYD